jgi:protocatechuate 3,4-dioxygenase beta subunit
MPCSGALTSANMEGPYYTPGSPQRDSLLEPGMTGTPILIYGGVFDQDCNPVPGAKVDFWQADANGVYDNAGYRLRGHVLTGADGFYAIETIAPGLYTGRPEHIHVKVFAPDGRELLTTQLYFPGSENSADVQAAPDLLVSYLGMDDQGRQLVRFNFVVNN